MSRIRSVEKVFGARFCDPPAFSLHKPRRSGAQAEGMRYERKVQNFLSKKYGWRYLPSPWIRFHDEEDVRFCQPDGLLIDFARGRITTVEVKLRHTADAYFQLVHLYEPVLKAMFPSKLWQISLCEICRWYDGAIRFPVPVQMRENIEDVSLGRIGVHILNP